MPFTLSADQIIQLAPDSGAARSGKELSSRRKWQQLGFNELAAWGECQGSSAPGVARRLGDIRSYFPTSVVRIMQQDALERLNLGFCLYAEPLS